jgi:hypothetical protein
MKNHLLLGNWNALCDSCGRKFKAFDLQKRWDGLMVCQEDFEQRHPQDLLKVQREKITVPWSRPYAAEDSFITNFGLFDTALVSDNGDQNYVEPGYFLQDYMQDQFTVSVKYVRGFADTATPTETLAFATKKSLADTTTITESLTKVMTYLRSFSDTASLVDSGNVFYTNYVGPAYFAEDYVGTTTTF